MVDFDSSAREWDNDPEKVRRATIFAKEIISVLNPGEEMDAFEFGCGTGLLSFQMKDSFRTITLADSSKGMIEVLNEKIKKTGIDNFIPLHTDMLENELSIPKKDVIYTLMALHHIPDIGKTLGVFNSILKSNGYLCIGDLVKEDGSFHSHHSDFEGHNGFEKEFLKEALADKGFRVIIYKEVFKIEKMVNEKTTYFPLFLMVARKEKELRVV